MSSQQTWPCPPENSRTMQLSCYSKLHSLRSPPVSATCCFTTYIHPSLLGSQKAKSEEQTYFILYLTDTASRSTFLKASPFRMLLDPQLVSQTFIYSPNAFVCLILIPHIHIGAHSSLSVFLIPITLTIFQTDLIPHPECSLTFIQLLKAHLRLGTSQQDRNSKKSCLSSLFFLFHFFRKLLFLISREFFSFSYSCFFTVVLRTFLVHWAIGHSLGYWVPT